MIRIAGHEFDEDEEISVTLSADKVRIIIEALEDGRRPHLADVGLICLALRDAAYESKTKGK